MHHDRSVCKWPAYLTELDDVRVDKTPVVDNLPLNVLGDLCGSAMHVGRKPSEESLLVAPTAVPRRQACPSQDAHAPMQPIITLSPRSMNLMAHVSFVSLSRASCTKPKVPLFRSLICVRAASATGSAAWVARG